MGGVAGRGAAGAEAPNNYRNYCGDSIFHNPNMYICLVQKIAVSMGSASTGTILASGNFNQTMQQEFNIQFFNCCCKVHMVEFLILSWPIAL
jgi:hypothetical protein